MARKHKQPKEKNESPSAAESSPQERESKPTAGDVKEEGFENTTWEQHTHHDAESTEAERRNTGKTLPGSSGKDR